MINFNSSHRFSAIFLVLAVCFIVSVSALDLSTVSLEKVGVDWDNIDSFTKDISSYGKYEIRNSVLGIPFLSLSKVADIELIDNSDTCGIDCFAEKEITLYNDGILIDDIIFKTKQADNSWAEQNIRSYQFSYQGEIQDYKTVCTLSKELSLNGTRTETCTQVEDGTHIGTINYEMGEVVKAGTYDLRLDGQKKPSRTVDWIVKTNGVWTDEWAIWGNISLGDDAEVILNSPADDSIAYVNPATFNASANVTSGASLVNISLWNNASGSWENKETQNIKEIGNNFYNYKIFDAFNDSSFNLQTTDTNTTDKWYVYVNVAGGYQAKAIEGTNGIYLQARELDNINTPNAYIISNQDSSLNLNKEGNLLIDVKTTSASVGGSSGELSYSRIYLSDGTNEVILLDTYSHEGAGSTNFGTGIFRVYINASGNQALVYPSNNLTGVPSSKDISSLGAGNWYIKLKVQAQRNGQSILEVYNISYIDSQNTKVLLSDTISDGIIWNVQACDSDGDCGFAPANFTVLLDDEAPTINITSGNGTQSYGSLSQNHTINYTITDSNLNSCWIGYNGTNNSIDCVSGESNSTSFALVKNLYNATIYANDSVGNLNSKLISWSYVFFEETSTFENIVYETDYKTFEINITSGLNILTQSGNLIYNGTTYTATSSCASGVCTFTKGLDIPLISSGESENRSFFWSLTLFDGNTSYNLNTSSSIQNTTRIHFEECAGIYTTNTINFTAYYETNLTRINPFYITGTFKTWMGSGSIYRTSSFNKASTSDLKLCITPTDRNQYSNAQIEYKFEDANVTFIPRNYFFDNKTLTNVSEDINLYLLEAEDSTSFIIKVQDQKLSPVTNALVYIQKYYPSDGTYRTVQIARTDSSGETLGFYETETVDYKHIIVKDGETLLETEQQKVVGKSVPYTLTFTIGTALGYPWTPFSDNENVTTNLTFNKDTNIVTFNYIENTTGYVSSGRLLVLQNSLTNSTYITVCNVSSNTASASLTCDLSSYNGSYIAMSYINGETQDIIVFIITDARDIFGEGGLFLGMLIIMVAGFAMMWNPAAGIISINAAVIFVNLIGFISVSPVFIFGMISISIITIILLKT